jgi:hypothetical protein
MDLNRLTKKEIIDFAEGYGIFLDASDKEEVLLSKLNEGLENLILKNGYVDIGEDDYRCLCFRCKKKITSEEILPDGYEEMYPTISDDLCESCFDKYS